MLHLCVMFERLGPYHHARLRAAGELGQVTAVEFTSVDDIYAWDVVQGAANFQRRTLLGANDSPSAGLFRNRTFEALDNLQPDVVAVPGWSHPGALASLAWCNQNRRPTVVMSESQSHDHARSSWRETVKRRIVQLNTAGLAGGQAHLEYLVELGVDRERIFTGYDVVDNDHFKRGAKIARENAAALRAEHALPPHYFLTSNRFIEKKNLARLLDAYADYRRKTGEKAVSLVMLGDGPLREELEQQVQRLGIASTVLFRGFQQYDALPVYYGLAQAFVHASTTEQWGLVVNEAMAAGLPVAASDRCGSAPELIEEGVNGYMFDPYDQSRMTELLLQMGSDPTGMQAMGQASQAMMARWTPGLFGQNLWRAAKAAADTPQKRAAPWDRALLWGMQNLPPSRATA